jgi:hypothetical protein
VTSLTVIVRTLPLSVVFFFFQVGKGQRAVEKEERLWKKLNVCVGVFCGKKGEIWLLALLSPPLFLSPSVYSVSHATIYLYLSIASSVRACVCVSFSKQRSIGRRRVRDRDSR